MLARGGDPPEPPRIRGACLVASRLVTVTVASTPPITYRDRPVLMCGTGTGPMRRIPECVSASASSFTPMKVRMADNPADRWTSRFSRPPIRKYSWRRPSRANALAVSTRYGSRVRPKIAGIESMAKTRSVTAIAAARASSGAAARLRPASHRLSGPGPAASSRGWVALL